MMIRIWFVLTVFFSLLTGVTGGDDPTLPLPAQPKHGRPFLMPPSERQRIRNLVASQDWARKEYDGMKQQAEGGNGYAAAFLYALDRNAEYMPAAAKWLLEAYAPNAYWVKKYSDRLADPEYFKGGQKDLADVYYGIDTQKIIAFDWVHDGLSEEDRRTIRNGLLTCARYRIRAMDRWTQTPNLVFKPTYVVALTGLVTRDQQCLDWGFRRTKPWGPHIGGYFTVLNHMLYDGGPWHESPIYPIAHLDLILSARMSRYLGLADGQDWFNHKLPAGGSPRGLMDYYLDTAYPIEQAGDVRRVRVANYGDGSTNGNGDLLLIHTGESDKKGNFPGRINPVTCIGKGIER